jgi:drug/metabolite transporter (DMT)-like permease
MKNRIAFIALLMVAIIYGLIDVLLRFVGNENYFSVVFFIFLFSTILLLPIIKLGKESGEARPLRGLRFIIPLGFFQVATWFLLYFAVMNTSIANAVFGYMTTPVFVIVLSPFLLKEYVNKHTAMALVLALVGVMLIFDPRNLMQYTAPIGIVSGILSGFSYAMVEILQRKLKDRYSPFSLTFLGKSVGMLIMFPFFLLNGAIVPSMISMMVILLLGSAGISGGILICYGLKHVLAQSASIILLLEPFISIVAAFMTFFEIPSLLTTLGASLLLSADIIIIRNQP